MDLKPLKCPWRFVSRFILIPVAIFLMLIVGALFFDFVLGLDIPFGAVYLNLMIQCGVWTLLSIAFFAIAVNGDRKLKRLKEEGERYEGNIEAFLPVYGVRILHYCTLRADCSYLNWEQKKCLVRSKAFLYGHVFGMSRSGRGTSSMLFNIDTDIFSAYIYVNRQDPRDYAVEILERNPNHGNETMAADYDFR